MLPISIYMDYDFIVLATKNHMEKRRAWCSLFGLQQIISETNRALVLSKNDMQLLTGLLDYDVAKRQSASDPNLDDDYFDLYICSLSVVNNHLIMPTLSSIHDTDI